MNFLRSLFRPPRDEIAKEHNLQDLKAESDATIDRVNDLLSERDARVSQAVQNTAAAIRKSRRARGTAR